MTETVERPDIDELRLEEERIAHTGGLARLAGGCARHPWRVVGGWIGVFVVLIGLNAAFHGKLINDFKIPGSDTQKATDLITAKFGGQKGAALRVVVAAPAGQRARHAAQRAAAIRKMLAAAQRVAAQARRGPEGRRRRSRARSSRARTSSRTTGRSRSSTSSTTRPASSCRAPASSRSRTSCARSATPAGIQVEFTGEAESAPPTQGLSDIIGLLAAFVILMVLFRALVPTVIPLLFAIVAVLGAFLILFLAARLTHFNTITEILVPMIGLGVGIDYTLFIVTRFRQFLHDGLSPQDAAAAAGATAGRAVIFAGVTVAISITGLALIGLDFITKLGIGSALGVLTAVLLANSLLPAVLSLLGHKIDRGRLGLPPRRRVARGAGADAGRRAGAASSRATRRSCCRSSSSSCCCSPRRCWRSRLGLADAGTAPKDQTTRKAYDLLTSGLRARASPSRSRSSSTCSRTTRAADKLETALQAVPGARAGRQADLQQEEPRRRRRSRSSTPTGSTSRRTRRPTTSSRRCGTP